MNEAAQGQYALSDDALAAVEQRVATLRAPLARNCDISMRFAEQKSLLPRHVLYSTLFSFEDSDLLSRCLDEAERLCNDELGALAAAGAPLVGEGSRDGKEMLLLVTEVRAHRRELDEKRANVASGGGGGRSSGSSAKPPKSKSEVPANSSNAALAASPANTSSTRAEGGRVPGEDLQTTESTPSGRASVSAAVRELATSEHSPCV